MAIEPDSKADDTGATELIAMAAELLSEAGDLACPSVSGFVEFMIDRLPEHSTGSR